jgi:dTDP-4-dehydrorhamnose reductase
LSPTERLLWDKQVVDQQVEQQLTDQQRILITGGSSYLGQHLVPPASRSFDVHYTYYSHDPAFPHAVGHQLDVRAETAVFRLLQTLQPDVVIHLAGSNRTPDMASVIVQGTRHVANAATAVSARLIHLSTDVLFDGTEPPYDETAVPSPVNAYGKAKAQAETLAQAHHDAVIIRTSLIYGLEQMDHGTRWMAEALQAGQPVTLFDNQFRNPVWVESLSRACLELANQKLANQKLASQKLASQKLANDAYTGILNVAGQQRLSRADFALRLLDWWGIDQRQTLIIGPSVGNQWPLDCTLDLSRATAVLQTPLPGVDTVIGNP